MSLLPSISLFLRFLPPPSPPHHSSSSSIAFCLLSFICLHPPFYFLRLILLFSLFSSSFATNAFLFASTLSFFFFFFPHLLFPSPWPSVFFSFLPPLLFFFFFHIFYFLYLFFDTFIPRLRFIIFELFYVLSSSVSHIFFPVYQILAYFLIPFLRHIFSQTFLCFQQKCLSPIRITSLLFSFFILPSISSNIFIFLASTFSSSFSAFTKLQFPLLSRFPISFILCIFSPQLFIFSFLSSISLFPSIQFHFIHLSKTREFLWLITLTFISFV